ncbi:anti-sigma factor [Pedobacter sp. HMWF019]|uniref:FecR family protein n=1 Tax=Pedobacter sp. HMWF019 TaxID=2056856 RepID=UPI000D39F13B|nr:FecR domain-containing protein [Pedobacter sp. HMWF019]PTS95368.1 anti-sigma factor [Pedobacter sp. HMWF019]
MDKQEQRLKDLFKRYTDKTISKEELRELFGYIREKGNQSQIEGYMKAEEESMVDAVQEASPVDWNRMYEGIISEQPEVIKMKLFPSWLKYTAAAVVLLVSYVAYTVHKKPVSVPLKNDAEIVKNQDIVPGGERAVLKLANGKEIMLDGAGKGILASEGNTIIRKTDDGRLIYEPGEERGSPVSAYNTITTPKGGQYKLTLPDKSLAWLNAASSITFPAAFNGQEREVEITGEVYFEITKDKTHPFHVKTRGASIEVLGTHFNVMSYTDEPQAEVTLLEGAVQVKTGGAVKKLVPGQQAAFEPGSGLITLKTTNVESAVDWTNGLFIFEEATVPEVMRQIARWYNVNIHYQGKLPSAKFTGVIPKKSNVSRLLKLLEAAGGVRFEVTGNTIEVSTNFKTNSI